MNKELIHLCSNRASNEGQRHYFLIKLNSSIITLSGVRINYIPVYTSTGTNTGDICKQITCIIPFNGIATMFMNGKLVAPLLKMDYIQAFTIDKNKLKQYYDPDSITHDDLCKLFNDTIKCSKSTTDLLKDYKKKVGNLFFFNNILRYIEEIRNFSKGDFKNSEDLQELNYKIGINNIFGINLSKIPPLSNYDIKNLPAALYQPKLNEYILNKKLNTMEKKEKDKYYNIISAPLFNYLINIITQISLYKKTKPHFFTDFKPVFYKKSSNTGNNTTKRARGNPPRSTNKTTRSKRPFNTENDSRLSNMDQTPIRNNSKLNMKRNTMSIKKRKTNSHI